MFRFFSYPGRLNALFADAVNIWLVEGDADALEIAIGAVKTASQSQRTSMISYATGAAAVIEHVRSTSDLSAPPHALASEVLHRRHTELARSLDALDQRSLLAYRQSMKKENETALRRGDAAFFRRRYPAFLLWADGQGSD